MGKPLPAIPPGKYVRRYAIFLVGILIMSIGIALSTRAHLGTSPISVLPFIGSLVPGGLSFGVLTIIMHTTFVLIQAALLRSKFPPIQYLQIGVGVMFGALLDVAMWLTSWANPTLVVAQWLQLLVGAALLAWGVTIQFAPQVLMNAGEGIVLALAQVTRIPLGRMKVIFDLTLIASGVVLSLILFHELRGVREGTIVLALVVGVIVGWLMPSSDALMRRILGEKPQTG